MAAGPLVWAALYAFGYPVNFFNLAFADYLLLVVLYPVLEEWIFRGNLQMFIATKLPGKLYFPSISVANLLTSLLFAGMHLFSHTVIWAIAVIFPSLVFGWAMERYKTLSAPALLHVFYNAGFFLLYT